MKNNNPGCLSIFLPFLRKEPEVLPARLPNLLINGTLGIAVGMATDIPPHNLREIGAATAALIENPHLTSEDLMEFVQGPDFPTGGIIYDWNAIKSAYDTGKGSVVVRAKTEIVENKDGAYQIIISEIPYRVITVEQDGEKLIVSERAVIEGELIKKIGTLTVGQVVDGEVTGVVDFGAFVKFGDELEGLVHISELAWQRIEDCKKPCQPLPHAHSAPWPPRTRSSGR